MSQMSEIKDDEVFLANRAAGFSAEPALDARLVEPMSVITWEEAHPFTEGEFFEADWALLLCLGKAVLAETYQPSVGAVGGEDLVVH